MKKKPGLSADRHDEIAAELQNMRDRLVKLSVEVTNAYPRSGLLGRFGKDLCKASDTIDLARCHGEDNLFVDDPKQAEINTYYRHPQKCGDMCLRTPQCQDES